MSTITCPSGLSGTLRGLKAKEERILADHKLAKTGGQIDQLLGACWEATLDPGPYDFDKLIDWSKVLQGDRFFALLQLRILSYGPEYAFSVPCEHRGCRARIEWELDLRDLPIKPLSDTSRQSFLAGNHFETVLPEAGRSVTFRLLTGGDERRLTTLRKNSGERPITTLLGFRIDSIDGVEPRDKPQFFENLGMADVTYLLSEFDRVDCGVETELEVECPECYGLTRIELPFDKNFFLPTRKSSSPR